MDIKTVGMQLYTLRDFCKTPKELGVTLEKVKKIGYGAVQVSGVGAIEPKELAKLLKDNGLVAAATHESFTGLQEEPQKVIDKLKTIGCEHTAVGGSPKEYHNGEGYHRFAKLASEVGETLREAGISFSYHNHAHELERYDGVTGLEIIRRESDRKYLGGEIDTYWIQYGGGDPAEWIRRFKGRIPLVHFKDMVSNDGKPTMAEVGHGNLDWPGIIAACKEAGAIWHLVEQDRCERDPFESAKMSFEFLKNA